MKTNSFGAQTQPLVKINRVSLADLISALAIGVLLLGLVVLSVIMPDLAKYLIPLRLVFSLVYILFAPGYLLHSVLFPRIDDLEGLERIGLSLGLSLGLIPVLALLLDRLPWRLNFWPVVIGQALLVALLFSAATVRRLLLPPDEVFTPKLNLNPGQWRKSLSHDDRSLFLLIGIALVLITALTAWTFLVPLDSKFMTEFYILGHDELAEDYPREVITGETISVETGITNREGASSTYHILVKTGDQVIGQAGPITLENKATWEQPVQFTISTVGDDMQVTFILNREGQQSPYRALRLWVNVKPAEAP